MGFEKSYQINIPSKGLSKATYSTVSLVKIQGNTVGGGNMLNPHFVTGFTDAEGCFSVSVQKTTKTKIGYRIKPIFEISLNQRDRDLLYQIKTFFGNVGTIRDDKSGNSVKYAVENVKDLISVIIPFFTKYPLLTQKAADFKLFVLILNIVNKGAHLTVEGLQQIINIKASMNFGVSNMIKTAFSTMDPVAREIIKTTNIPDPNWVSGFVSGEGNFDAGIREAKNAVGARVYLRFRIAQHSRDVELMKLIVSYLGVGRIEYDTRKSLVYYISAVSTDLTQAIIPFFNEYPIIGTKYLDYQDWCKIANLVSSGANLTKEGFEEIKRIEAGMNRARKS